MQGLHGIQTLRASSRGAKRWRPGCARVFSDEIYEDIVFDGVKHESIAALPGMAGRTVVVSGVSKSYAFTGARVGWALFPTDEEAQAFRNLNINYFSCVPGYAQEAARVALESPLSPPAVAAMVAAFQSRRDAMVRALNAIEGVRCATPKGAFYLFPSVDGLCRRLGIRAEDGPPATQLQMFLLFRYGVATLDRRSFGRIGADRDAFLRISTAVSQDDLDEAARRIAQAASDSAGFASFLREWNRPF